MSGTALTFTRRGEKTIGERRGCMLYNVGAMKIVIAPQAFKGSISALDVAAAMGRGVLRVLPDAETVAVPVADGGATC